MCLVIKDSDSDAEYLPRSVIVGSAEAAPVSVSAPAGFIRDCVGAFGAQGSAPWATDHALCRWTH